MPQLTLTREELHALVWEKPMIKVAAGLGMSSTRVAQACDEMGVPRPKQGYWLVPAERRPPVVPLGPLPVGKRESRLIGRNRPSRKPAPRIEGLRAPEQGNALDHPLIQSARRALARCRPDDRGCLTVNDATLTIRVTPATLERALAVMAAVIQHAEANEWKVTIAKNERRRRMDEGWPAARPYATLISIGGRPVEVSISEKVRTIRRNPTAAERARLGLAIWDRLPDEHEPTGLLSFRVHGTSGAGARNTWTDAPSRPLESRIGDIARGLASVPIAMSALEEEQRARRDAYEREAAQRKAAEARAADEARRIAHLVAMSERHARAGRIRALVTAARGAHGGDEAIENWAAWADGIANGVDPVTSREAVALLTVPDAKEWPEAEEWTSAAAAPRPFGF